METFLYEKMLPNKLLFHCVPCYILSGSLLNLIKIEKMFFNHFNTTLYGVSLTFQSRKASNLFRKTQLATQYFEIF